MSEYKAATVLRRWRKERTKAMGVFGPSFGLVARNGQDEGSRPRRGKLTM